MLKAKNLMALEYTITHTGHYEVEMVALFNSSRIDEEEVRKLIKEDRAECSPFVAVMYKTKYENLFDIALGDSSTDDFYGDLHMEQKEQM